MIIDTSTVIPTVKAKASDAVRLAREQNAKLTENQRIAIASTVSAVVATSLFALITGR